MSGDSSSETMRQALVALKDLRAKLAKSESANTEPIAIVGMACRFPGGSVNPETYWKLLRDGDDALIEVPKERWDIDAFYHPDPDVDGKMYTRFGGFLREPVDRFDPEFFSISPREAESMDPQQRLLLQVSWEALERAGIAPDSLIGSPTSVFLGISNPDYGALRLHVGDRTKIDPYYNTGCTFSVAAGRISYTLGLQGPCVPIDTACSSSLVAVSLAMQSLRRGDCDMALAAGVNLMLVPDTTIYFCKLRALSPSGPCRTFDAAADGYARGEGCGVLVLKRLEDAITAGDNILALLRGSSVNHDGRSSGLTIPNGRSQQQVMKRAFDGTDLKPQDVSYVEAHGTGTSLGDPIEAQSISRVFGQNRSNADPLWVGSVKTNFGHLEAAAGIASIIKVVLALQHETIPQHLHFQNLNSNIPDTAKGFEIPTEAVRWEAGGAKRIAGVSSFGISGTNAHVIVEEAPASTPAEAVEQQTPQILTLRAKNVVDLELLARRFEEHLAVDPSSRFSDVCITANTGRARFDHRLALVARTGERAVRILSEWRAKKGDKAVWYGEVGHTKRPPITFLFAPENLSALPMSEVLYGVAPVFQSAVQRCGEVARSLTGESVLGELYASGGPPDTSSKSDVHTVAAFTLQYALSELLGSWNIRPTIVYGEGMGECVAAVVAGIVNLEDGLRLALQRGGEVFPREEKEIHYQKPKSAMVASLTGCLVGVEHSLTNEYWDRQSREPADGAVAVRTIDRENCSIFLEISSGMSEWEVAGHVRGLPNSHCLSCLDESRDDWEHQLETLAELFVSGLDVDWQEVYSGVDGKKVTLPTYPFKLSKRYWFEDDVEIDRSISKDVNPHERNHFRTSDETDILQMLTDASSDNRGSLMSGYLSGLVSQILKTEESNVTGDSDIHSLGLDSLMAMDLIQRLKTDLKIPVYPREIFEHPILNNLGRYLIKEMERVRNPSTGSESIDAGGGESRPTISTKPPQDEHNVAVTERNTSAAFVLSAPRSGSTLLRVMLAGHPDIFAPPELHLLPYADMSQWHDQLADSYLNEGLLRAFMELHGLGPDHARNLIKSLINTKAEIKDVYRLLQEESGGRLLVDKSPSYAGSLETLERAESLFSGARYIFLIRHPSAVIESFVRNRMDRLGDLKDDDPYQIAEKVWVVSNQNMMRFMSTIEPTRGLVVHFEDLVTEPESVSRRICTFLELPYNPALLLPYHGDRMTDGVTPKSMVVGDPNFLTRDSIDPSCADAWKGVSLPRSLSGEAREVANHFDYEVMDLDAANRDSSSRSAVLQENFVELGALTACVCEWGPKDGPAILCLHGILDQGALWGKIARELVQRGFRVIAPDLRGHGRSEHASPDSVYQMLDFVVDVDALVRHIDVRFEVMVGHSMGAVVAGLLAVARPELAGRLVLVEPPVLRASQDEDKGEMLRAYLNYAGSVLSHPVFPTLSVASKRLSMVLPSLSQKDCDHLALRITKEVEGGVTWTWDPRLKTRSGALFESFSSGSTAVKNLASQIAIPATIVFGRDSEIKDHENVFDHLQKVKRVTVQGGHHPHLHVPDQVSKIM